MKKKLVITLLMATVTATVFVGCSKKNDTSLSTEGTAVALCEETEIETETEEETETETENSPLVYDENGCIVIDATKENPEESKPKENKETASNDTDGRETTTKPEFSNGNSNASSGTNNETSAPVETPVETPTPEPTPNLCPYGPMNTWIDFGDGWWGYYSPTGGTDYTMTYDEMNAITNELSNYMVSEFIEKGYTYDNSYAELVGTYDDTSVVTLTKFHFVLAE